MLNHRSFGMKHLYTDTQLHVYDHLFFGKVTCVRVEFSIFMPAIMLTISSL